MTTEMTDKAPFDGFLRENPQLNDPATVQGMADLVAKLAPLLQGQRFHNLVDLLSAVSDVVDMADDAMIQKVMKAYENVTAGAFNISSAMSYAAAQAGAEDEPPTVWQALRRLNRDPDARRGLAMTLSLLGLLGRQARQGAEVLPDD